LNKNVNYQSVQRFIDYITTKCDHHKNWAQNFRYAFTNTLETTVKRHSNGTTFLLTGDIPAMWLRDSTAQVRPYLVLATRDENILNMIIGLVKKQFFYINIDPYANAFNETDNGAGHQSDCTKMNGWIWERKYEIDSLCYPIQLAYLLFKNTNCIEQFNDDFVAGVKKILEVFEIEQNHTNSNYSFIRNTVREEDTLTHQGKGVPVKVTGMTWSGFRPSDDACSGGGYLIPSNMFAVVVLDYVEEIFRTVLNDIAISRRASKLKKEIESGIRNYGKTTNINGEIIYAYETDGFGNSSIMDDSNVPSLLSAPYIGYLNKEDPLYLNTRKTILSKENPYYYEGECGTGIGSSHTPDNYIWPIAIAIEGLTTNDFNEKERILNQLVANDGGTNLMHESYNVSDSNEYTREWFSWANMLFCELVMDYFGIHVKH